MAGICCIVTSPLTRHRKPSPEEKISISFEASSTNEASDKEGTRFRELNYLEHAKSTVKLEESSELSIKPKDIFTSGWFEFVMFSSNFFSNLDWNRTFWEKVSRTDPNHFLTFNESEKKSIANIWIVGSIDSVNLRLNQSNSRCRRTRNLENFTINDLEASILLLRRKDQHCNLTTPNLHLE